jgi:uncharacterized protein (TIGR00725 family)
MTYVAVIGPDGEASVANRADARELGRLLAERGAYVLTGGLGGVMAAAAEGAAEAGGTTIGLLPGTDRSAANRHLTVVIATGLGQLRNGLLVRAADGLAAVGGSWGTMSEIALAHRLGRPLVCLDGWTCIDAHGQPVGPERVGSPAQAVDRLLTMIAARDTAAIDEAAAAAATPVGGPSDDPS